MRPVPLFIELCAGLASVSGCLQHGAKWKPPVSRMGRKTGYAEAILDVMGLRPRQGAEGYVWAEADGDVAALLAAYTQPDVMREIAAIIRSWIPCPYGPHSGWCARCKGTGRWDARDLWEVLRMEERRGLWEDGGGAREVAAWVAAGKSSYRQGDPESGGYTEREDLQWVARHCVGLAWPPVLIAQDARVEPGEVAGWLWTEGRSIYTKGSAAGFLPERSSNGVEVWNAHPPEHFARAASNLVKVWPPVALTPSAHLPPSSLPAGSIVYMDPPYLNTTPYKFALPRAEVVAIAERWHDAGARVYISEAEPIPIKGWHHVEITGERRGQARTFGATREFLTCSHPPARRQAGLFR